MNNSDVPSPEEKEVSSGYNELQSKGEDLGYGLTPESVNTQPTPDDLLQAAAAYAQAAMGSGTEVNSFKQTSEKPETWQAQISNGSRVGTLVAKRVPGGYNLYVEGATGSTEGKT
ncbi:MAG: hypothetical protein H7Y22_04540 [Gemmatimonadaceae bacterium]|nr:hypothetical protein [Gloeobacterales cyanobacterium ES-bin-141]